MTRSKSKHRYAARALALLLAFSLATMPGCASLRGLFKIPSGPEAAIQMALRVAVIAAEQLPRLVELIADSVAKRRKKEKRLRAVAQQVYSGECLTKPAVTEAQSKQLEAMREQGRGVLLGGLRMLADSKPKDPRDLLLGVALLTESGLSQAMLRAGLALAESSLKVMQQVKPKDADAQKAAALDIAQVHYLLGAIRTELGQFKEAEQSLKASMDLRDKNQGRGVCLAESKQKLGNLYVAWSKYKQAEPLYADALKIKMEVKKDSPMVADALTDLADYHVEFARYPEALDEYKAAAGIYQAQSTENPKLADTTHGRGVVFSAKGDRDHAEKAYMEALEIRSKARARAEQGGPKQAEAVAELSKDLAVSYDALGNLFLVQGSYERAQQICEQAVQDARAAAERAPAASPEPEKGKGSGLGLGGVSLPKQADVGNLEQRKTYAQILDHCGDVYLRVARERKEREERERALDKAAKKYKDAYDLRQVLYKGSGKNVSIAESLLSEAALHRAKAAGLQGPQRAKEYELAEARYREGLRIQEKVLGNEHPQVAQTRAELGELYRVMGKQKKSEEMLRRALEATPEKARNPYNEAQIREELAALYLSTGKKKEALALLAQAFALSERFPISGALRANDSRLDAFVAMQRRQESMIYSLLLDPAIAAEALPLSLKVALVRKGRSLAETAAVSLACEDMQEAEMREMCTRQKGLLKQWNDDMLNSQTAGKDRQEALQRSAEEARRERDVLLSKLGNAYPQFAEQIRPPPDQIIARVAERLPADGALVEVVAFQRFVPGDVWTESAAAEYAYVALVLLPGGAMRSVPLGPGLERAIEDFSGQMKLNGQVEAAQAAAGRLHALVMKPLAGALAGRRQVFLSMDQELNRVPFAALYDEAAGRYLIDGEQRFLYLSSGADLLRPKGAAAAARPRRVAVFAEANFGSGWEKIDTSQEMRDLKTKFPGAEVYTGERVTKDELLRQPAPAILHMATHGLFLRERPGQQAQAGAEVTSGERGYTVLGDCLKPGPDPMLNLLLALSGASLSCTQDEGVAGTYASAADLSTMNLRGTQLVVLSACETGLGARRPGQGVYGMRRALRLAGSETQVTSLWNANDAGATPLFADYYARLSKGEDRIDALRDSARAVKEKLPHPYYWAVFVASGDGGPLEDIGDIVKYKETPEKKGKKGMKALREKKEKKVKKEKRVKKEKTVRKRRRQH